MRLLRAILGLTLIPLGVGLSRTAFDMLILLVKASSAMTWLHPTVYFGLGFIVWLLIFIFLPVPMRAYILAHELTHALWGALFGAQVSDLRVNKNAGSVKLSRLNWLIVLAPYFFPFYTVVILLFFGALAFFWDLRAWEPCWLFLTGFSLAFHWTFTIDALRHSQSDVRLYGRLFSYVLIYNVNIGIVLLAIFAVGPIGWEQFSSRLTYNTVNSYESCVRFGRTACDIGIRQARGNDGCVDSRLK